MIESGKAPFLKPNPQALARGATVISKAPFVSREISIERLKHFRKKLSVTNSSLRLTRLITELSLNGDRDWSKRFSSASISGFKLPSCW